MKPEKIRSEISVDMETLAVACSYMDSDVPSLSVESLETSFNMIISAIILWDSLSIRNDISIRFANENKKVFDDVIQQVLCMPRTRFVEDFITGRLCDLKTYEINDNSCLELNYLPNPLAASTSHIELQPKGFDRRTALYPAEKTLKEFYDELNAKFGKKRTIVFPTPLLYDYIRENTANPVEQLEFALKLREMKSVTEFRESLGMMDKLLNEGRLVELDRIMRRIDELCKDIVCSTTRKKGIGKIKVKWTFPFKFEPTKEFEVGLPTFLKSKHDRNLHLTFLADLMDFGLTRRRMR